MGIGFLLLTSAGGAVVLASLRLWLKARGDCRRLEAVLASTVSSPVAQGAGGASVASPLPAAQDGMAALARDVGVKADLIVGFANVLLAAPRSDADGLRWRQALGAIRRTGDDIRHAVEQMLAGPDRPRPLSIVSIDPYEPVRMACKAAAELAGERNVVIRHPTPQPGLCLMADAHTLARALRLLIAEAVHLSRSGGGVLIAFKRMAAASDGEARADDPKAGDVHIAIEIRDTRAAGGAPTDTATDTGDEAMRLLTAIGGRLERATDADGAVHTLILPAAATGRSGVDLSRPLPAGAVLHIDGQSARAALVRHAIQVLGGVEAYACTSLEDAPGLAADLGPDIILVDQGVCPDGAAGIAARLGQAQALRAASWVLVGGSNDLSRAQKMQALGFAACLDWPLDLANLEEVVRRLLNARPRAEEGVAARVRRLGL